MFRCLRYGNFPLDRLRLDNPLRHQPSITQRFPMKFGHLSLLRDHLLDVTQGSLDNLNPQMLKTGSAMPCLEIGFIKEISSKGHGVGDIHHQVRSTTGDEQSLPNVAGSDPNVLKLCFRGKITGQTPKYHPLCYLPHEEHPQMHAKFGGTRQ